MGVGNSASASGGSGGGKTSNPNPVNNKDKDSDPNEWWKSNGRVWPQLKPSALVHSADDKQSQRSSLRFVVISDTHNRANKLSNLPAADVLLHCGDFTNTGSLDEITAFNEWLGTIKHLFKHRIIIAGNHDLALDANSWFINYNRFFITTSDGLEVHQRQPSALQQPPYTSEQARAALTNATAYLCDTSVTIPFNGPTNGGGDGSGGGSGGSSAKKGGVAIYGSPYQPEHQSWAFNLKRGAECAKKWSQIPTDGSVDILMTHGPAIGHGDQMRADNGGGRAGCVDLYKTITTAMQRAPPVHCFGHVHEGYGVTTNGTTVYMNASTLGSKGMNPPIVFDFPLPAIQSPVTVVPVTVTATSAASPKPKS